MRKAGRISSLIPIYLFVLGLLLTTAVAGNRAISVLTETIPVGERKCVVIDAGHGGVDGGATSCTGVLESSINLEIALKLDDLMHLLGIDTLMIRTSDISIHTEGESIAAKKVSDLKQRVKIANEADNAIVVSIHQNHFSDSRYNGAQVFFAGTAGSNVLAKKLQNTLVQILNPNSNRQAKKADGVYLMQNINCTGILVECGFLSNPEEEAKLRNDTYQKQLCCTIASVISLYMHGDTKSLYARRYPILTAA